MSDPEAVYESYGNKLIGAGASSGDSGGHTIQDSTGTDMAPRSNLQIIGAEVTDDSTNDRTVITISSGSGIGTAQLSVMMLRYTVSMNSEFKLKEGSYLAIRFTGANDYPGNSKANLSFLTEGVIPVKVDGNVVPDEATIDPETGESDRDEHIIKAGETGIFVYDGTYLNLVAKSISGHSWTKLGEKSNEESVTVDLSNYSEVLVATRVGSQPYNSFIIPVEVLISESSEHRFYGSIYQDSTYNALFRIQYSSGSLYFYQESLNGWQSLRGIIYVK